MSERRTVLITGAAAGIGRATAQRFLAAGWRVGAYDIDEAGLDGLRAQATAAGAELITGRLDVTDTADWQARLTELVGEPGRLDVLVNNAGVLAAGDFAELGVDTQAAMVEVNVTGVLRGCHAAHPYLAATPGARVINLCSASAIYGQPELAVYGATKSAVRGLTEALDLEWSGQDITVRALWPLFVDTGMISGVDTGSTRSLGVHLGPGDVADAVFTAATERPGRIRRALASVHRPVGRQAALLMAGAEISPSALLRVINRRIGRGR